MKKNTNLNSIGKYTLLSDTEGLSLTKIQITKFVKTKNDALKRKTQLIFVNNNIYLVKKK